uniref:RRM domain-containing protein n=1 Tax=Arcella intermedia TaxID=1963864 RepID=A0A6B2LC82_9EUKA
MHFSQYGPIAEVKVIIDKQTGQSKCYGFVTFTDPQTAAAAVVNANPIVDGKQCNTNLASMKQQASKKRSWAQSTGNSFNNSGFFNSNLGSTIAPTNRLNKRMRSSMPIQHPSYVAKLKQSGIEVTKESVLAKIEVLKQENPPEALKYFLEFSEFFRGTPDFNYFSNVLLEMAKHFRKTGEIKEVEYDQNSAPKLEGVSSDHSDQSVHYHYDGGYEGYEQYYQYMEGGVWEGEGEGEEGGGAHPQASHLGAEGHNEPDQTKEQAQVDGSTKPEDS